MAMRMITGDDIIEAAIGRRDDASPPVPRRISPMSGAAEHLGSIATYHHVINGFVPAADKYARVGISSRYRKTNHQRQS